MILIGMMGIGQRWHCFSQPLPKITPFNAAFWGFVENSDILSIFGTNTAHHNQSKWQHFCSLLFDAPGRHLPDEQEELNAALRRQRRRPRGRRREGRGRQEGRIPPIRRGVRHSLCHAGNPEIEVLSHILLKRLATRNVIFSMHLQLYLQYNRHRIKSIRVQGKHTSAV